MKITFNRFSKKKPEQEDLVLIRNNNSYDVFTFIKDRLRRYRKTSSDLIKAEFTDYEPEWEWALLRSFLDKTE